MTAAIETITPRLAVGREAPAFYRAMVALDRADGETEQRICALN